MKSMFYWIILLFYELQKCQQTFSLRLLLKTFQALNVHMVIQSISNPATNLLKRLKRLMMRGKHVNFKMQN